MTTPVSIAAMMAKGMIQNGLRMKGGWIGRAPVK